MSNVDRIGELLDGTEQRDAIHIAIAPVVAGGTLPPATPVTFRDGDTQEVVVMCPHGVSIGIVDPFLKKPARPGDRIYIFLNPNTITSLRHEWTHPAFSREEPAMNIKVSEQWLKNFCDNNDAPDYEDLMKALKSPHLRHEVPGNDYNYIMIGTDYIYVGGQDAHCEIPDEFWDHAEIATGKKFKSRPTSFSCSC